MHYQAAEKSLMFLNSEQMKRLVSSNMQKCYPVVVKNLINSQKSPHWNQTVTTITYQVIRTYMEMDKQQFERLSNQGTNEEKIRKARQTEMSNKWQALY